MGRVQPQMRTVFNSWLARFEPTVTSVMHGHHEGATSGPNEDPHYAGRAVDIGAFGGVGVGMNQTTWDVIAQSIASGMFSRIGTISAIADNPAMQALAREYGVILFPDAGSGPHVHFEIGR